MSVEAITWALKQRTGGPGAKIVLLCLANYADELGRCWPSQAVIADQTEQSVDSVQRRLKDLETAGLVRREQRIRHDGGRSSDMIVLLMQLPLPQSAAPQLAAPQAAAGAGRTAAAPPTALVRQHESLIDTSKTQSRAGHDELSRRLREAGGAALDETSTGLIVLSDPLRWLHEGCDLDDDVLPAIRARTHGRKRGSIRSWAFFNDRVFEARDRRLAPGPAAGSTAGDGAPASRDPYRSKMDPAKLEAMLREHDEPKGRPRQ